MNVLKIQDLPKYMNSAAVRYYLEVSRCVTVGLLGWKLGKIKTPRKPIYKITPRSLLYVAASSLPYHTSGYTTRTHEVIHALMGGGAGIHVITRPGYPWDRKDRLIDPVSSLTAIDGVSYLHVRMPANNRPVLQYALQAASIIANEAKKLRVAVIHAASNHVNSLPALLAARRLGIPFQYEMRGLWELTRVSRQPGFEGSPAYRQGLELEGLVAKHADRLFVISEQLMRYAELRWSVPVERMALLPNCVSPERFPAAEACEVEPRTIGYAGSLIIYEGLDTLIEAMARLKQAGIVAHLRIVGDGEARTELETLAVQLGVTDRVQFMGRLLPEAAREVIRRSALVCLPRKPYEVCRIVPPIKMVEAMAMGKPVIVPDLPVFRDELGSEPAGWFFQAGDAVDLARVIEAAFKDEAGLTAWGARAREYAILHRNWAAHVPEILG